MTEKGSGMNIHTRKLESEISESEVNEALSVLKKWRDQGGEIDLSNENIHPSEVKNQWVDYPKLNDKYPTEFNLDADYKASLPDLQNGPSSLIKGSNQVIQHVWLVIPLILIPKINLLSRVSIANQEMYCLRRLS